MSWGGGGIKETGAKYSMKDNEDRCPRNRLMGVGGALHWRCLWCCCSDLGWINMPHSSSAHNLIKSKSQREAVMKDSLNFFIVFISSVSLAQIKTSRPFVSKSVRQLMLNREKIKSVFGEYFVCSNTESMIMYLQQVLHFTQWVRF